METIDAGGKVLPRLPNSRVHSVLLKDWLLKQEWCEQQGWGLGVDYWAPGAIDRAWYFKEQKSAVLFALRWL